MKDELQLNGFQELTEEESTALEGGALGIASIWVNLAANITRAALGGTGFMLGSLGLPVAGKSVGLASGITSTIFSSIIKDLSSMGL